MNTSWEVTSSYQKLLILLVIELSLSLLHALYFIFTKNLYHCISCIVRVSFVCTRHKKNSNLARNKRNKNIANKKSFKNEIGFFISLWNSSLDKRRQGWTREGLRRSNTEERDEYFVIISSFDTVHDNFLGWGGGVVTTPTS